MCTFAGNSKTTYIINTIYGKQRKTLQRVSGSDQTGMVGQD
jgi:hypothetical protein